MSDYKIVLALADYRSIEDWISLADALLPEGGGEIHLRAMVTIEEGRSLSEGALPAREWRSRLNETVTRNDHIDDMAPVYVDYRPFMRVLDDVSALGPDLLLVQWDAPSFLIGGLAASDALRHLACDVALVSGDDWWQPGEVLLALRGAPNISLGVRVAEALAGTAPITLYHAARDHRSGPEMELVMESTPQISRVVTSTMGTVDGIVRESIGHKVLVMGTGLRQLEPDQQGEGDIHPIVKQISQRTGLPVILVRVAEPETIEFHAPRRSMRLSEPLNYRVDRWFAENTFHSGEFSDLQQLMSLKEKQGVTISLALPALNEEETVGSVIGTLKQALQDDVPLLDEIILMDSNSEDRTVAIAQEQGIPTYIHQEVIQDEVGSHPGKGEALWKSLAVTKGDIVVWVDTDITNIHPRFIYGLVGPLLKQTRIQYVKGFYARPIRVGDRVQAYGGGRVTELVARPLLNLFYPELSGIIQPLSGEYAGRRTALEQVPFFSGYGVETGLLIDMHARFGLEGIAQSDLEVRVHHNQTLANLSRMSFAILQVFTARIEQRYGVTLLDKANRSMKLVVQEPDHFALDIAEISDIERPPIASIASYRNQHRQRLEARERT